MRDGDCMPSSRLLKLLSAISGGLLLLWLVYLCKQVPRRQDPFAKSVDVAEGIILEEGPSKIVLKKEAKTWKVGLGEGPFFPAEEDRTQTLLSALKGVQLEDVISDRADRAADFEVNPESGTRVRLLNANGATLSEGIFGEQAPDFNHIYFRFPDKPHVYLARGLTRGELGGIELNGWRDRRLFDLPEAHIQAITIESQGFKTDLIRTSTDAWTMNGHTVDPSPVNALIGTLAHLRADDFVDPATHPALSFEGLTFARLSVKGSEKLSELRMGVQDSKTKRYPVSIGKDASLAWVSEHTLHSILLKPSSFKPK